MRIISLHVLKWAEEQSIFLCSAYDLSFISWYQRSFFKESVNFGARTASNRTKLGESLAIHLPEQQARCYIVVRKDGLAFAVLADDQYPERIAFMVIRKMINDFNQYFYASKFNSVEKDNALKWDKMDSYITKFQDPKEVDKLEKLKNYLKEVEYIVHKNLDDLLKRGEDLDRLMQKSQDVSKLSYDFYRTAKKTNSRCCSLY